MGTEALFGTTVGFFSVYPLWVQGHLVMILQLFSINSLWVQEHLVVLLQVFSVNRLGAGALGSATASF